MRIVSIAGALVTYTLAAAPSAAAPLTDGELRAALAELEVLKERQAETDARIRAIESKLLGIAPTGEPNEGADVGECALIRAQPRQRVNEALIATHVDPVAGGGPAITPSRRLSLGPSHDQRLAVGRPG